MTTRRTRHLIRLTIPLAAAALAAAAVATPASALAGGAPRTPAAHNAVAAYMWWDDENTFPANAVTEYSYNSTGDLITINSSATGEYTVDFGGLASIAGSAIVQVTTYEDNHNCAVAGWGTGGGGGRLSASVYCYTAAGAPVNSYFDLIVTRPTSAPHGTFDYSYVYKNSGRLTAYQYNSAHKENTVKHLGTGKYQVTLGGPKTTGTTGIAKVSAYGAEPGDCELVKWYGSATGEIVDVDCYNVSHHAQNRNFMVTYASASNLMGQNGFTTANAFANGKSTIYQPSIQYDSAHGARVTVVHYTTGYYEVVAVGSGGNVAEWGGDVQVNAVGSSGIHCVSDGWDPQTNPSLDVYCYGVHGNAANSPFAIEWVVP